MRILDRGFWRIVFNEEIHKLHEDVALTIHIRLKVLRWVGHIIIMEERRISRLALDGRHDEKECLADLGHGERRWSNGGKEPIGF